jgi:hypothetical protein
MRYVYFYGCWLLISMGFTSLFAKNYNLLWFPACLAAIGATGWCVYKYYATPEEQFKRVEDAIDFDITSKRR